MSITISATDPRIQYTATNGQTTFAVPFEFFTDDDLVVKHTSSGGVDTTLTKAASPSAVTQYSVSGAGESGGGNITLGSGATAGDKYTITRNISISRSTDFPTSGTFPIETLNTELDKLVAMIQQKTIDINLSPRASSTTSTAYGLTFPELVANKLLTVNSAGNGLEFSQEIGTFKGNWSASVAYVQRDIIKDTSTNNIFICNSSHTSSGSQPITTNTDSAKWDLLVDASSATTSATNAATSATAAANSATAAATSATNSATSATNAATSETNAGTSETNAATSASAASSSASAAATSATNAATSESNASTSATAAASSATSAASSATTATTQASAASTSATNAATSATNASTSETNAAASATTATTQASNAATSATNAATSATAAQTAQAAAEAAADNFDDTYLGAKASDPTLDNDGDALTTGDLYFNTSANELKVYNGSS